MKFTTPCFVRVEDAEKRDELLVWLKCIGYGSCDFLWGNCIKIIRCWTTPKGVDKAVGYPCKQVRKTDIDCGENIELFKALAAMNDENDLNQWYVCDVPYWCDLRQGDWVIKRDTMDHTTFFPSVFHKATVAEIIEHFKKREK
jgi:hypothetical protein